MTAWEKFGLFHLHQKRILEDEKVSRVLDDEEKLKPRPNKVKMVKFNGGVSTIVIQVFHLLLLRKSSASQKSQLLGVNQIFMRRKRIRGLNGLPCYRIP